MFTFFKTAEWTQAILSFKTVPYFILASVAITILQKI